MDKKKIDCKLVKLIGVISETDSTEKILAIISWNGRPEKLEIRYRDKATGNMQKGIAITEEEIQTIYNLISGMINVPIEELPDLRVSIDLTDYLKDVSSIKEIRKVHATKDGLVSLHRKHVVEILQDGELSVISMEDFNNSRGDTND